ncbi:phosphorylated carbohydrates phosphatase [Oxobacter pfennigii]|uniref:Phosphorylated carbohydrates phosphatase n=1 Tax=Oxobacter pfennigii TaxID=36849 RepID=A0A0P8WB91_9CLOT|nr:HAD family phosphatase [Oxobacter pfennigii]KPU45890.1 phosphorylated carbohydrates phosphatase [Oxobacter pfennigii]
MFDNFDAVIFDMDGTLIDSMWVWRRVDEDFLQKRNIEVPVNLQKEIEGSSFLETAQYFKDRFNLNENISDIVAEWICLVKNYYENVIALKPGAFDFINMVKENNLKIGLATCNSRDLTEIILKRTGIDVFFNAVVTGSEVTKDKTCPDIFLEAAAQLDVHPSRCLVFEDTLSGVQGAKRAGMTAIAVHDEFSHPYKEEIASTADRYIIGFTEI